MRALEPEVFDAVWAAVKWLLPPPDRGHPLGCHRPRIADRVCFRGIMIRLVTGASWVDVEAIMDFEVSDTTLRGRRDEWIAVGVFDRVCGEALEAFDRIVGLDVALAAHLVNDFHTAACDRAILVTNDGDFKIAIKLVVDAGHTVDVISPASTVNRELERVASTARPLRTEILSSCQMPDRVTLPSGYLQRPEVWK